MLSFPSDGTLETLLLICPLEVEVFGNGFSSDGRKQSLVVIYNHKADVLAELKQSILVEAFAGELTANVKVADCTLSEATYE